MPDLEHWQPIRERHEIYAHREIALERHAVAADYAHLPAGMRVATAKQLCMSAARIARFDTLTSHLRALELTDA